MRCHVAVQYDTNALVVGSATITATNGYIWSKKGGTGGSVVMEN